MGFKLLHFQIVFSDVCRRSQRCMLISCLRLHLFLFLLNLTFQKFLKGFERKLVLFKYFLLTRNVLLGMDVLQLLYLSCGRSDDLKNLH